jgi:hypothetical protein
MITSVALLTAMWMVGPQPWDGTWSYDKPQVQRSAVLPPVKFDHPYSGKLYISAENSRETILTACGFPASDIKWRIVFGCAKVIGYYIPGGPHPIGAKKVDRAIPRL